MTRARKFSGKTQDEATENALAELGVELEDVEIKVISAGRSGILGLGGQTAEIEVSLIGEGGSLYDDDDEPDDVEDSVDSSAESAGRSSGDDRSDDDAPRGRGRGRGRNRGRSRGRGRGRGGRDRDEDQQTEGSEDTSAVATADRQPESQDEESSDSRRGGRGGRRSSRSDRDRSSDRDERSDRSDSSDSSGSSEQGPSVEPTPTSRVVCPICGPTTVTPCVCVNPPSRRSRRYHIVPDARARMCVPLGLSDRLPATRTNGARSCRPGRHSHDPAVRRVVPVRRHDVRGFVPNSACSSRSSKSGDGMKLSRP